MRAEGSPCVLAHHSPQLALHNPGFLDACDLETIFSILGILLVAAVLTARLHCDLGVCDGHILGHAVEDVAPPIVPLVLGLPLLLAETLLQLSSLRLNRRSAAVAKSAQALSLFPAILHQDLLPDI
eukprot:CAMPEP_0115060836 /NCGR_PEP_ID=MMETSP0227-20121206/7677_1 /TAXON_ID=89957 /ORGANISM="Polarella glacialis, Strain CCMP 1383" /LENGTH=125 /DNA_ID=CAMNT_0002446079 /DNA_START=228 /DNA_END=606 /DNA_ORIENTATION=-